MIDIVIVGAGTAGLSAAIYALRAGRTVAILEAAVQGGQIINTPHIANYPGISGISGFEFATNLFQQATDLGATVVYEQATALVDNGETKIVKTANQEIPCRAVILATGAAPRPLGLPNEKELIGSGVSYCATCDGAFFRGRDVAVVGGGNTAIEDALYLAAICQKVYLIHRRDGFRAEPELVESLRGKPNVEFALDHVVARLTAAPRLQDVVVEHVVTKAQRELAVDGIFVAVGQLPQNDAFSPPVHLDESGYILAGEDCKTNVPGVFAAGDGRTKTVRQLVTAASDGAIAAIAASAYM